MILPEGESRAELTPRLILCKIMVNRSSCPFNLFVTAASRPAPRICTADGCLEPYPCEQRPAARTYLCRKHRQDFTTRDTYPEKTMLTKVKRFASRTVLALIVLHIALIIPHVTAVETNGQAHGSRWGV